MICLNTLSPRQKGGNEMKEYKIVLRIDNIETPVISIEAENWQEVVNHILGNVEIVDTEEE